MNTFPLPIETRERERKIDRKMSPACLPAGLASVSRKWIIVALLEMIHLADGIYIFTSALSLSGAYYRYTYTDAGHAYMLTNLQFDQSR
jgi:hypothetical protein